MWVVSITTLPSSLIVGYAIDRHQRRKRWVYASSAGLALVCVAFIVIDRFSSALIVAAFFGLCYGAYFTSDWALALALLPGGDTAAKYMGIWGIAGTFSQVLAPGIGGLLLDAFNRVVTTGVTLSCSRRWLCTSCAEPSCSSWLQSHRHDRAGSA